MNFAKLLAKFDSIESKQTLNEGWDDMMKASKEKSEQDKKEKGTGKFDKKETSTGTVYTRKSSTFDDGGEDKDVKKAKAKDKKKVGESSMADLIKAMDAIVESEKKVDEEEVEEGPEIFKLKADAAKKAGEKEFKGPDGKMHPVKESEEKDDNKKPDEDGDGVPDWADKKPGKDDNEDKEDDKEDDKKDDDKEEVDEGIEDRLANLDMTNPVNQPAYQRKRNAIGGAVASATPASNDSNAIPKPTKPKTGKVVPFKSLQECYDQAMAEGEDSGMNISSNMDTNSGSKSLTVSARGEAAEELAKILKLSGLIGQGAAEPQGVEVEMGEAEYANEPAPMIQGIDAQLQQGNDLNAPKGTHPKVAGGDNPMQAMSPMQTIRIAEDKELQLLESRLAKELEAIKIQK